MSSKKEEFLSLCKRAKQLYEEGDDEDIVECLNLYKQALKLNPGNVKLTKKIRKLELVLNESMNEEEEEEEDDEDNYRTSSSKSPEADKENIEESGHDRSMTEICEGLKMPTKIYKRLYGYQKEGVSFFFKLFTKKKGGILGDDMGLGKTIQVCSFLSAMFKSKKIKHVIIVLPPPLIINWTNELKKWSPDLHVYKYHESTVKQRAKMLLSLQKDKGILLTTYNMVVTSVEKLVEYKGRSFIWDYCILDEGHKIKNPSAKTTKALHQLSSHHRIILSGTPIMNNLKELWSLFDWTHHGQLLGSLQTFTESYENPICKSREKDATRTDQRLGEMMGASLQSLIEPYLLRRSKRQVQILQRLKESPGSDDSPRMPELGVKNDLICWLRLSDQQLKVYNDFSTSEEVKNILLNFSRSPLIAITVLKKICDHPRLLSNQKCSMLGVTHEDIENEDEDDNVAFDVSKIPDHVLMCECGKMSFVVHLLEHLKANQHRTLLFSQSRRILDIIQKIATARGHRMLRLDGSIKSMQERQDIIEKFQSDEDIDALLLTSRVGGVGLNLIAADRVIIYDPAWNPSVDSQAIDRAFRIGQQQDVVVYRLITCGTVEEKIYRRQIYKDSVSKKVMKDSKNPTRHFTREEIRSLFKLGDINNSETQVQITTHVPNYKPSATLQSYMETLLSMPQCTGVSDHDLVFCRDEVDEEVDVSDDEGKSDRYLDGVLSDAFRRLNMESEENKMMQNYQGGGSIRKESRPSYKAQLKQQWNYNRVNTASIPETVEDLPAVLKQYAYNHTNNIINNKLFSTTNNTDTENKINNKNNNSNVINSAQQNPIILYSDNEEVFDDIIVKKPVNNNVVYIDVDDEGGDFTENKDMESNKGMASNNSISNNGHDNTYPVSNFSDKLQNDANENDNNNDEKTKEKNNMNESKKFGGLFMNVDDEEDDDDQESSIDEDNGEDAKIHDDIEDDDADDDNSSMLQEENLNDLVVESTEEEDEGGENNDSKNKIVYSNDFSIEESEEEEENAAFNNIHNRNEDKTEDNINNNNNQDNINNNNEQDNINNNNEQDNNNKQANINKGEELQLENGEDDVAVSEDEVLDNDCIKNVEGVWFNSETTHKTNDNAISNESALATILKEDYEVIDNKNKDKKYSYGDDEEDIQDGNDDKSLFDSTDDAINESNSLVNESLLLTVRKRKKVVLRSSDEDSEDDEEKENDEEESESDEEVEESEEEEEEEDEEEEEEEYE